MKYVKLPNRRKCIVCGRAFIKNAPQEKMCSDLCREMRAVSQGHRLPFWEVRKCTVCDGNFTGRPNTDTCSQKCRYEKKQAIKNGKRRIGAVSVRSCAVCQRKFVAFNGGRQIYCSSPCRKKSERNRKYERQRSRGQKTRAIIRVMKEMGLIQKGDFI